MYDLEACGAEALDAVVVRVLELRHVVDIAILYDGIVASFDPVDGIVDVAAKQCVIVASDRRVAGNIVHAVNLGVLNDQAGVTVVREDDEKRVVNLDEAVFDRDVIGADIEPVRDPLGIDRRAVGRDDTWSGVIRQSRPDRHTGIGRVGIAGRNRRRCVDRNSLQSSREPGHDTLRSFDLYFFCLF